MLDWDCWSQETLTTKRVETGTCVQNQGVTKQKTLVASRAWKVDGGVEEMLPKAIWHNGCCIKDWNVHTGLGSGWW